MKRGLTLLSLPFLFIGCSFDNSTPPLHGNITLERRETPSGTVGLRGDALGASVPNSRDWETGELQGAGGTGVGGSAGPGGGSSFGSGSSAASSSAAFSGSGTTATLGSGPGSKSSVSGDLPTRTSTTGLGSTTGSFSSTSGSLGTSRSTFGSGNSALSTSTFFGVQSAGPGVTTPTINGQASPVTSGGVLGSSISGVGSGQSFTNTSTGYSTTNSIVAPLPSSTFSTNSFGNP